MHINIYDVEPNIPEKLAFLEELSRNLWWSWNREAQAIFYRIDSAKWIDSQRSPLAFLDSVEQSRFDQLLTDEAFLAQLSKLEERYRKEIVSAGTHRDPRSERDTAYFCLEYGIHESVRIYSGGLGVLAGDHLKAASDQNAPFMAVGLLYRQGYFQQYLNQEGWQQEHYPENPIHHLPIYEARDTEGRPIRIKVPLPEGDAVLAVGIIWVGNTPLYLLDANIPENKADFRGITARLYDGDKRRRLQQEILLAIGGFRALVALGYEPSVCHMNEGHAAFLSLARIEHLMKSKGIPYPEALEIVSRSNVFTTHTPVAAGNEWFEAEMIRSHLDALKREMDIEPDAILAWGMPNGEKSKEICNTIMALRMSHSSNAVSKLHGEVARDMWAHLWHDRPKDEVPIGSITNAVHAATWVGDEHQQLYNRYLGPEWQTKSSEVAKYVDKIPNEELWRAHEFARTRLIRSARERMESQYRARNATASEIERVSNVLKDDILTVGFARRFATYKRATLLLNDPQRLKALLTNQDEPIQFIFAGKAHPADNGGKELIRHLLRFAREEGIGDRLIFLEDYDIALARQMVQGVDVWLNTPRRPMEASGTSGMKACLNGALHLSILDGWWAEAYNPGMGWAIGDGRLFEDQHHQDAVEAQALFNLLEKEVVPLFYKRKGEVPVEWIEMNKASIENALEHFTSCRMYSDYQEQYYGPSREAFIELTSDNATLARKYVQQRNRLNQHWKQVSIGQPSVERDISTLRTGDTFTVEVEAALGDLRPEEVELHLFYGPLNTHQQVSSSHFKIMNLVEDLGGGRYKYSQDLRCDHTGRHGFTCRAIPAGDHWRNDMPGFVTWV